MADQRKRNNDDSWFPWALMIFLFVIKAWPIALILLFVKLFADDEKKERTAAPPLQKPAQQRSQPMTKRAAQQGAVQPRQPMTKQAAPEKKARAAMRKAAKSPSVKKSNAWLLKIAGAALTFFGVMVTGTAIEDMLYLFDTLRFWLPEMLQGLAFLAGGLAMLYSGFSMDKSLKRYAKYLSVMGDREAVPVEELARTLGYSRSRVEKDLQKMIDRGYFGGKAYLNVELGYLFRSGKADAEWRQRQQAARAAQTPPAPKEAEEGYSGILRNIRRANDDIADPVLSAKIGRLEEITARIFRAVEEDPGKRDKIDTFLNYYLPTTQKLLDSYAEFEAAGVEGENLRQAKERIESTMDAIVRGFEHQLDELYKADVLDVDSDIRVMEHMLRRDTATTEDDFG